MLQARPSLREKEPLVSSFREKYSIFITEGTNWGGSRERERKILIYNTETRLRFSLLEKSKMFGGKVEKEKIGKRVDAQDRVWLMPC